MQNTNLLLNKFFGNSTYVVLSSIFCGLVFYFSCFNSTNCCVSIVNMNYSNNNICHLWWMLLVDTYISVLESYGRWIYEIITKICISEYFISHNIRHFTGLVNVLYVIHKYCKTLSYYIEIFMYLYKQRHKDSESNK